jgi:replicative superfamily II helicase
MKEVGLVVVDESRILATSCGDAVETSMMRFTNHCHDARIVFLSATMSNTKNLAAWLTVLNEKKQTS